ncbi:hypothetical protein D9611_014312 [Ephemerocybe angulata]|uniref:Thiolase N-terminal domain-containing protein n=1 Tax=Ephemerocybe angulata TaxID=980116 RepID=A0A8H5C2Y5_9AGAR|nr:hypothetical protein D9611_014312 [Tulosesus angulatus]
MEASFQDLDQPCEHSVWKRAAANRDGMQDTSFLSFQHLHLLHYYVCHRFTSSSSPAKSRVLEQHDHDIGIVPAVRRVAKVASRTASPSSSSCTSSAPSTGIFPPGGGASAAFMAALHAGIAVETSLDTVNRQRLSGLTAVTPIVNEVKAGQIEFGIGTGVESMSNGFGAGAVSQVSEDVLENKDAEDCLLPMGNKAAKAQKEGRFKDEILPIKAKWEHGRGQLTKLSTAKKHGLRVVGKFVTSAVVGVLPAHHGRRSCVRDPHGPPAQAGNGCKGTEMSSSASKGSRRIHRLARSFDSFWVQCLISNSAYADGVSVAGSTTSILGCKSSARDAQVSRP